MAADDDPLFLQIKEARASVLEPYAGKSRHANHGQRVVVGQRLMAGLRELADRHGIPLRPQGPGCVFHAVMLKPGAEEGPVMDYRDYVRRQDAPRWAHLRR